MAIITIDGLDGSGKETLSRALVSELKKQYGEDKVEYISFPDYTSASGKSISEFLSGKNNIRNIIPNIRLPYLICELFAINRREYFMTNGLPKEDKIYVYDRYSASNILYQAQGFSIDQINALIDYNLRTDYDVYKNPIPDFSIFLRVPYFTLRSRLDARKVNKNGAESDAYEADSFLKASYHLSELLVLKQDFLNTSKVFDYIVDGVNEEGVSHAPEALAHYLMSVLLERGILPAIAEEESQVIDDTQNSVEKE